MTPKKYILLFLFLGLIPVSCFEAKFPYYVINKIIPEPYKDAALTKIITTTDTLTNDSVYIKLNMITAYIAQKLDLNFTSTCMATKKETNGQRGLKDPIREVIFSSNKLFNGRPANSNLNALLKFITYDGEEDLSVLPGVLNKRSPADFPTIIAHTPLYLTERPTDSLHHTFTIQFIHSSGTSISAQFKVNWK